MTLQAQSPHIGEVALAAAFDYGYDVVGIPEVLPSSPILLKLPAGGVVQLALVAAQGFGVDAA